MNKKHEMNKQRYNRKRRLIFCIFSSSTFFTALFYVIFYTIAYGIFQNEVLSTIIGIICFLYIVFALLICERIYSYKHPEYGAFTFADEFKNVKKYNYKDINFIDFIENKLISEKYTKYESEVDFIKGFYYYKSDHKKSYYITLFIDQEMTKKIYKDYTENSLCSFLDTLVDKEMLEDWRKIYFTIILKEDVNNNYLNDFIHYNLLLPVNIGYLPIVVNEKKKYIKIASFDYGSGLTEYDQMKKELLASIDEYIINEKNTKKKYSTYKIYYF